MKQNIAFELDAALREVCSIIGVSIGVLDDKSTWRVDFAPEATAAEIEAAHAMIVGWGQ